MRIAPGIADAALLDLLISEMGEKLTPAQLETFVSHASDPQIRSGAKGLPKAIRDKAVATARAAGLLPKVAEKKRTPGPVHQDCYSERRSAGTEFAEQLLSRKLPSKPPGRGRAA